MKVMPSLKLLIPTPHQKTNIHKIKSNLIKNSIDLLLVYRKKSKVNETHNIYMIAYSYLHLVVEESNGFSQSRHPIYIDLNRSENVTMMNCL